MSRLSQTNIPEDIENVRLPFIIDGGPGLRRAQSSRGEKIQRALAENAKRSPLIFKQGTFRHFHWRAVYLLFFFFFLFSCAPEKPKPQGLWAGFQKNPPVIGNSSYLSREKAEEALWKLYGENNQSFFCGCVFDSAKQTDKKTCRVSFLESDSDSQSVVASALVPPQSYSKRFRVYRTGHPLCFSDKGLQILGTECVLKVSRRYNQMANDLYNLLPALKGVRNLLHASKLGRIKGEAKSADCQVQVVKGIFEPPKSVRGDIARIYFYMHRAYPGYHIVNTKNRALLEFWDQEDPVDGVECEIARRIEVLQGNANPLVKNRCGV